MPLKRWDLFEVDAVLAYSGTAFPETSRSNLRPIGHAGRREDQVFNDEMKGLAVFKTFVSTYKFRTPW